MRSHILRYLGLGATTVALLTGLSLSSPIGDLAPRLARAQVVAQQQTATSGIQIQNLSTSSVANVVVTYYSQDGTNTYTLPGFQIQPGKAYNIYNPSQVPSGFVGSVVVESDQPVAAIARTEWSDRAAGSYSGASTGSTSYNVPLVLREYYSQNSRLTVQNVDTTSDANITVRIVGQSLSGSIDRTLTARVKPGFSITWDQNAMTDLGSRFIGAATITADRNVVAVADVRRTQATGVAVYEYSGFSSADAGTKLVAPLVRRNWYGFTTGFQIQNTSSTQTANVQVDYVGIVRGQSGTVTRSETVNIPPGQSVNIYHGAANTVLPDLFLGAATVTSLNNVPIVGIVNDLAISPNVNSSAAHNMEPVTAGTSKLVVPLIRNAYPATADRLTTGLQVMNVGTQPTTIQVQYLGQNMTLPSGQDTDTRTNVQPGASVNFFSGNTNPAAGLVLPDHFLGAAIVTSSNGQPLVGLLNDQSMAGTMDAAAFNALHAQ